MNESDSYCSEQQRKTLQLIIHVIQWLAPQIKRIPFVESIVDRTQYYRTMWPKKKNYCHIPQVLFVSVQNLVDPHSLYTQIYFQFLGTCILDFVGNVWHVDEFIHAQTQCGGLSKFSFSSIKLKWIFFNMGSCIWTMPKGRTPLNFTTFHHECDTVQHQL